MNEAAVRAALEALAEKGGGRLTPAAVVAAARHPESALHGFFTWDDAEAADKRRLDEARRLIRSVTVVVTSSPTVAVAPMYIRDPTAGVEQGYVSIGRLRTDADASREAVLTEFNRAIAALRRAKVIASALNVSGQIADAEAMIAALSRQLSDGDSASD